ncbi:MAG: hypothetical protein Ct9H90mP17_4780 [Actinomycetota bacterium]|nr:MAG: hypothetical protein Ct9H90mP17_4780 [Actinomycetota bacterium]
MISISQPGVLYYSVTNQILESVKNLGVKLHLLEGQYWTSKSPRYYKMKLWLLIQIIFSVFL